jgi:hypothetical protein
LAKCGSELFILGFRIVIHILTTVVAEWIAHVVILGIAEIFQNGKSVFS